MSGKTIVVTGASDGIGAAAALRLTADGHRVVVVGRDPDKAKRVAAPLACPWRAADFARLDDVHKLADWLLAECDRIDVLANNAGGIFGRERVVTQDGHELTLQVNFLAPFLLTELLHDRLIMSRATVINTSSVANRMFARLDVEDLELTRSYSPRRAYGNAKLSQIMHARELQSRYGSNGLTAVSFHPGNIATSFARDGGSGFGALYGTALKNVFLASPMTGADTLVFLAESRADHDIVGGEYYVKRQVARANPQAYDEPTSRMVWDKATDLLAAHQSR